MKHLYRYLSVMSIIWIAMCFYCARPLFADTFCRKVSDGETIWVADESGKRTKIRMSRIDAPEMNQPYFKEASSLRICESAFLFMPVNYGDNQNGGF